jgi:cytoskeletal protein RodZ
MPDLPPHTVFSGEMLRRVREGRGLSVRDLADRTKLSVGHIENIEADHYAALPVPVYLRGFLMLVARELRLDPLKVSKSYLELVARAAGK